MRPIVVAIVLTGCISKPARKDPGDGGSDGDVDARVYKPQSWKVHTDFDHDLGNYAGRIRALLTGPDGTFSSGDLSPGTYALDIKTYGTAHKWLRAVAVASEQVLQLGDIVLDAGATVRGVLVAGADHSPIGFTVHMDGLNGHEQSIDGIDGKFEFTGLEAGHPRSRGAVEADDLHRRRCASNRSSSPPGRRRCDPR
jgi:hypothetical protein